MSKNAALPLPHSWEIESWPQHAAPGTPEKARYWVRAYRDELITAGALVRVGRTRIIIGANYARWLASKGTSVRDFPTIAPNRPNTTAPAEQAA